MGLKTKNYTVKKTGLTLPTAYAKLRTFVLNADDTIRATFGIHTSRENLDSYEPVDVVTVQGGKWDRTTSLQEAAYDMAKNEKRITQSWDEEKKEPVETVEYGPLYGWDNDIVKGDTQ
jgi:hypothetical protein